MMKNIILILTTIFTSFLYTSGQVSEKEKRIAKQEYNKAIASILSSDYQDALSYLEKSVELNPSDTDARSAIAKLKVELGRNESALTDFRNLIMDKPSVGEYWFYVGYLSFNGLADSLVFESLDKSISLGYQETQAYYYRGLTKHLMNDLQGAIADYTKAIEKTSNHALAYHDRGSARRSMGDMQGALNDYRMATSFQHDFPVAFNNMGSVKIVLGDYEGAVQDYTVAIRLDTTFAIAYNNRGAAKYYLGFTKEALLDFEMAVGIEETYVPALNNQASSLAKEQEFGEALAIFDAVVDVSSQQGTVYLNRGLVRELTGDLNGACADWNKAFELGTAEAEKYLKECK